MSNCSIYGKSLEYALCQKFMDKGIILSPNSFKNYEAYSEKWNKLAKTQKDDFMLFSKLIVNWCKISDYKNLEVSLAQDHAGKSSKVADVIIKGKTTINLSIKNNKDYVKSHRPGGFSNQAKLDKKTSYDYKQEYNQVISLIYKKYENLKLFKQISINDKKKYIYNPIYDLTEKYLYKLSNKQIEFYFEFLSGSSGFYQCLNTKKEIIIHDRTKQLPKPILLNCSRNNKGYLVVSFEFENRDPIKFSMRVHSASSRITKNISLKFDVVVITPYYDIKTIQKNDYKI